MPHSIVQNILLFSRLSQYSGEQIYQVIHDESPQTVAVVLARLDSKKAKEILNLFPVEEQKDLIYRMATAKSIPSEFLNEVANIIGSKLRMFDPAERDLSHSDMSGQDKMAEILKHMGASKSKELLDALAEKDAGMSDRIKRRMFLFEDIVDAEPESLKRALMQIETDTLALALKGSTKEIFQSVSEALSENRRKLLISELKYMGPRYKSEIEKARTEVVSTLRGFFDQGILRMKGDLSEDEWV